MQKYLKYLPIVLGVIIIGLIIYIKSHKCQEIVNEVLVVDTIYQEVPPIVIHTKPKNKVITKYKTITETEIDTVYEFVHDIDDYTFTSLDTIRKDSQFVAIKDFGNCLGITERISVWGGKEKIVTKTITKTLKEKVPLLSLYGGVSGSYENNQIKNISPSVMLLIKNKLSLDYNYRFDNSHNVGVKVKLK